MKITSLCLLILFSSVPAAVVLADAPKPVPPATARRVEFIVTTKGFQPDRLAVRKGEALNLVFTRKTEKTCAKQVVIRLGGDKKLEKDLPLDKSVEVAATFSTSGEFRFSCGMDMISGVISVQ